MANKQQAERTVRQKRRIGLEPVIFHTLNTLYMLIIILVMVYPFWNTIAVSFNDAQDSLRGGITLWPRKFSLYSYEMVFRNDLMGIAAINSVLRTVIATFLSVFVNSMIAFVLSRKEFLLKKFATAFFMITMYVSAGLIPNYFLMRDLKLINTFWVYVLPGIVSAFSMIVIKSFMQSLPESLSEAARVDGAGYMRIFVQIILPCCMPVIATVALWAAVGAWNAWFDTFIYASSNEKLTTLQYEMMKLLSSASDQSFAANTITPTSIRAAVTVVASVPILAVYPFLQKYFVKGVTLGAVKG